MIENVEKVAQGSIFLPPAIHDHIFLAAFDDQLSVRRRKHAVWRTQSHEVDHHLHGGIGCLGPVRGLDFTGREIERRIGAEPYRFISRRNKISHWFALWQQAAQQPDRLKELYPERLIAQQRYQ